MVAQGRLAVAGILQEQHPDRARLFHQWQGMDFPLLVDGLNRLGVKVVPIHLLLDAQGRIFKVNPSSKNLPALLDELDQLETKRAGQTGAALAQAITAATVEPDLEALARAAQSPHASDADLASHADAQYMWGDLDLAIQNYQTVIQRNSQNAAATFRLGVALRRRYENNGQLDDFRAAIQAWQTALAIDPNQYIWRRRIQQYGPRLDKPYPFYDWVPTARAEIRARGLEPVQLRTEPRGAEIAQPSRSFAQTTSKPVEPDPGGKITRDSGHFIAVQSTLVADTKGRPTGRVHLQLTPQASQQAHWNNEAEPVSLWLDLPEGWQADAPMHQILVSAESATSQETRQIEFELQWPKNLTASQRTLHGYLLYNVCEEVDGTCLYRRQDVKITW
jgi:tetratricopeptide (TPR) repeat protein